MLSRIYNIINKSNLSNPFTSLLMCTTEVQQFADLLCLSFPQIKQLHKTRKLEEKEKKLDKLCHNLRSQLDTLAEKLLPLILEELNVSHNSDFYSQEKNDLQDQILDAVEGLQDLKLKWNQQIAEDNQKLNKTIFLLEYDFYLYIKLRYAQSIQEVMSFIQKTSPLDVLYKQKFAKLISTMSTLQAEYLSKMDVLKTNMKQYQEVLPEQKGLQTEQREVDKIYKRILIANQENVEYIKCKLQEKQRDIQELLFGNGNEQEKLSKTLEGYTAEELHYTLGLIAIYNYRYIANKWNIIFNILIHKIVMSPDIFNPDDLITSLNNFKANNKFNTKDMFIFEYFIYLSTKLPYLVAAYVYIDRPIRQGKVAEDDGSNDKRAISAALKQYQIIKETFQKNLPKYLKLIKDNPENKELQQCIPKTKEIEDIFKEMDKSDQKLLMQLQKETKTGIILPGILLAVGTFVTVGIVYVIYRIITPKKAQVKVQKQKKITITRK